jgi:hypothetical protein
MHLASVISITIIALVAITLVMHHTNRRRTTRLQTLRQTMPLVPRPVHEDLARTVESKSPDEAMLYAAQLYKRGVYGRFAPQPDIAHALCRSIVLHGRSRDLRMDAMQLLYEPEVNEAQGSPFPTDIADHAMDRFLKSAPAQPKDHPPSPPVVIRSDPQNAHQHTVVASTRKRLESMDALDDSDIIAIVEAHIESNTDDHITDETKAKALHALDSINTIESTQFGGVTEQQVLARVWNRAKPEERDIIIQQLASAIEHGSPVCHTGKVTRLVGAVDHHVLPTWQVREQLQSEAARIRNAVLDKATPSEIQDYNTNDDAPLRQRMIDEFSSVSAAYMKKEGFDTNVLQPTIDAIIDHGF